MRDKKGRFVKGKNYNPKTEFKKGTIPWNKGKGGYSTSRKGKPRNPNSGFQEGHKNYNKKGYNWKMKSRIKLSLAQTKEKEFTGFKREIRGRIMRMGKYLEWRSAVFKRDNYHCQNCPNEGYIEAHHIIPFSEIIKIFKIRTINQAIKCKELWDVGNGITYCRDCHILIDESRGRPINKKIQLNSGRLKI